MKRKTNLLFAIITCLILSISCKDKEEDKDKEKEKDSLSDNEYVNNWLMDKMQELYLWNDKLPLRSSLNFKADPYDFYRTLLDYEKSEYGSTYSRIEGTHNNLLKTTKSFDQAMDDVGFEYFFVSGGNYFLICYIKPKTKAEKLGLKRGDIIWKVDDQRITEDNFFSVLNQNKQRYKLLLEKNGNGQEIKEIELEITPNYKENPILIDSVYTIETKKIGYVMYNSFSAGGETDMPYDVQLASTFAKFQAKGVTDLVLDFRYNGGGLVRSVSYIVSALAPGRTEGKIFAQKRYNPDLQQRILNSSLAIQDSWFYEKMHNNIVNQNGTVLYSNIPKLGDQLNSIYVLGTEFTASSSELTINSLNPFMPSGKKVKVVGESTHGKNVGSWPEYEENDDKNTYVMHAIGFEASNIKGETSFGKKGFPADIEVNEFMDFQTGMLGLGDVKEPLLAAAIYDITGTNPRSGKSAPKKALVLGSKRGSFEHKFSNGGMVASPKK